MVLVEMESCFTGAMERCWKIYRRYYAEGQYKHHQERYREEIRNYLKPTMRLLDAGCGRNYEFTREFVNNVQTAVGVDITELKTGVDGICGVRGDLQSLPFKDNAFDLVISMSVLEHLSKPESVFGEFSRVLKRDGLVILQTPNKYDYVSLIAKMTPFRFHQWILLRLLHRKEEDTFPTFFRANTKKQITALLEKAHIAPLKTSLFNQYPAYLMFSSILFRVGIVYERITSRYVCLENLRGWILHVGKKT
jgi:ubiquinone/menaquinone biosynthesis C-methylase UbiE